MNIPEEWGKETVVLTTRIFFQLLMNDSRSRFFPEDDYYSKEHLYVPKEIALLVRAKDPKEVYLHIEEPHTELNPSVFYEVWDMERWRESSERRKRAKEWQRKCTKFRYERDEQIRSVFRAMEKRTGRIIDIGIRKEMVRNAINSVMTKSFIAEHLGVDTSKVDDSVTKDMYFVGDPAEYFQDLWKDYD